MKKNNKLEVKKYRIILEAEQNNLDNLTKISVKMFDGEDMMAIEAMHLCCGAIGMLIKGMHKTGIGKDYELLKEVIDHLKAEFESTTDFEDSYLNSDILKGKKI